MWLPLTPVTTSNRGRFREERRESPESLLFRTEWKRIRASFTNRHEAAVKFENVNPSALDRRLKPEKEHRYGNGRRN